MKKVSVYQNNKKVYVGYIPSETEKEIIEEFASTPLPGTYQGSPIKDGDVIVVNDSESYEYKAGKLQKSEFSAESAEDMDGTRVLMAQPGFPACETRLRNTLKALQDAVSDHREPSLIEYSFPYPDDCMILGNEEAKLINMPLNRVMNGEVYAGTVFVVADNHYGELRDLTDEEVEFYMNKIGEPQKINPAKVPYLEYFGY